MDVFRKVCHFVEEMHQEIWSGYNVPGGVRLGESL